MNDWNFVPIFWEGFLSLLSNCTLQSTNNTQDEYKYYAVFVLQRTGWTGFLATRKRTNWTEVAKKKWRTILIIFRTTKSLNRWQILIQVYQINRAKKLSCTTVKFHHLLKQTETATQQQRRRIPFRFTYFCHAFPVNKYPRNSPART